MSNENLNMLQVLCTLISDIEYSSRPERKYFERIVCADGFSVSVQASEGNYCSPRDSVGPWESVECGFPTTKDPVLEQWAENPNAEIGKESGHVQTVYGWVPSQIILQVIESHGGMISGELPAMIDDPEYEGSD